MVLGGAEELHLQGLGQDRAEGEPCEVRVVVLAVDLGSDEIGDDLGGLRVADRGSGPPSGSTKVGV
eukprot:3185191-Alexandrium_andersonii.AAC.1